jgi:DNA-binding SARP family transcriptional activator
MDTLWRIKLFGSLSATLGSQRITHFRSEKTGELLAYLAFHSRRSHRRELLLELLWSECAPESSRHRLRNALSSLRHQLQPAVILADRATAQLNPTLVTTDVDEFETHLQLASQARGANERVQRLTDAVAVYEGELLSGYFAAWIVPERQRLHEEYLAALSKLVAQLEQLGDRDQAIRYAKQAIAADPVREETQQELIRLLAAAGKPAAARRQYQQLEQALEQDLTVGPAIGSLPAWVHPIQDNEWLTDFLWWRAQTAIDRERSVRQQMEAQAAEMRELRRQLAAQKAELRELRRQLHQERGRCKR